MMFCLKYAGIVPKKHIIDNEVAEAMKTLIYDEYQMEMEHVPPRYHHRNAAEVVVGNLKAYFNCTIPYCG